MIINVQMYETKQSFTSQLIHNDCDFKVELAIDDMVVPVIFKEEVS